MFRYISNHAAAEQLYDALFQWNRIGSIIVTATSQPFFNDFLPGIAIGTYASGSSIYNTLVSAIKTYADGYLEVVQAHTPSNGSLSEQFSRTDGTPLSAVDLTWSYASFITAAARRNNQVPASWGEPSANTVSSRCSGSSATGTYAAPPFTSPTSCSPIGTQSVTFNVARTTVPGERLYIVGNTSAFGDWNPSNGIEMSANSYQSTYPRWYTTVEIDVPTSLQYKYYQVEANGNGAYENGGNRELSVQMGTCEKSRQVVDTWQS